MAEPLSTDDIEDVVSSVRRLVSPDARPRTVSRDLGMEKLLLTPALRVMPEAEIKPDTLVLTQFVAETAPEVEDVLADVLTDPMPAEAAEVIADVQAEAPLHVVEGEWEDAFWSEPEPDLAELALEVEEAELVAPQVGTEVPADVMVEAAPEAAAVVIPDLAEDALEGLHTAAAPEPEPELAPEAAPDVAAEADTDAPADAAPWEQDAENWPDGDMDTAPEEAAILPFPKAVSTGVPDGLASLTDADGNPVTVLDEAALNEIVRNLIREELQGVLGERITHNVRKLVRAEINRALTARSLD
ncbi:hypothetical protein EI545_19010 [Tabrizicola piscis]|uniref:DUF2497 domain-containing protein n=1 Tax=Tabrizicola piscis TaxID=2494374 RepID=A0A3S8UB83_9RHOB|nr:hypothetical protein [Tabrizicola piscis]AZL60725.1 hypothetical protein EI545_19010 [Tabrizicola piscis]